MFLILSGATALCVAAACDEDTSTRPSAAGGQAGVGGTAVGGAAGDGGTGVINGGSGLGGRSGAGGDICFQGTTTVNASVTAAGLDHPDGTVVTATFGRAGSSARETKSTVLDDGAFQLSFESPGGCNLGATREEPIVVYIDLDGDGVCRLVNDEVFAWVAAGGPSGNDNHFAISPEARHCEGIYPYLATMTIDAARLLCPEVTDCLPFCGEPEPLEPDPEAFAAYCPERLDGGVVDGGNRPDGGDVLDGGNE